MLSLSQVTGQEVMGPNGEVVGRVTDLTARLDDGAWPGVGRANPRSVQSWNRPAAALGGNRELRAHRCPHTRK